jgi:hypothetical protein
VTADPTYKGKLSLLFFPWDLFGHKVSELLFITIKVPHGDLVHWYRSIASLPHDLGPKGTYFGGDKFGLEGMT